MTGLRRVVMTAAVAGVAAAIAAAFAVMGSPAAARTARLDERRVEALAQLARDIDVYWSRRGTLPESLDALAAAEPGLGRTRRDPEDGTPFAYRATDIAGDTATYELCATFRTASDAGAGWPPTRFWAHGEGRQCYNLTVKDADP